MRWLYTSGIFAYVFSIKLAALFGNKKAKLWVRGRKGLFQEYTLLFENHPPSTFIWFHVSSLGEFEQGRPVIEGLRTKFPNKKILLSFFSPSGYEIRKNYSGADYVMYLPFDCLRLMRKFVTVVNPAAVVFVKYDFWFNFIKACSEKNIPVYFISAAFRHNQYFFKPWGKWFLKHLKMVNMFFVQTHESEILLQKHGISQVQFAGDTRLDRVIEMKNENKTFTEIEKFINNRQTIVAGSTWPADENIIMPWMKENKDIVLIIAPHDISEHRLKSIEQLFDEPVSRHSQLKGSEIGRILLIDSIGILSHIYKYSQFAIIGNGFGRGIHNILEAIVFGKPVLFGPNFKKFTEAVVLSESGGAFPFRNTEEFSQTAKQLLSNEEALYQASESCLQFVEKNRGATQMILDNLHL